MMMQRSGLMHAVTDLSPFQANQVKDPGALNQITRREPSRIGQQSMQPFQARFLNPDRRAALFSGKEVDRRAYTQSDAPRARMIGNAAGENFLLGHSYREKHQRSSRLDDKVDTLSNFRLRSDEPHGKCMNENM